METAKSETRMDRERAARAKAGWQLSCSPIQLRASSTGHVQAVRHDMTLLGLRAVWAWITTLEQLD